MYTLITKSIIKYHFLTFGKTKKPRAKEKKLGMKCSGAQANNIKLANTPVITY